jgi:hypothetical protein
MFIKGLSVLAIACAMAFVAVPSSSQTSKGEEREQQVLKAENELNIAQEHADLAAMDHLYADNYTHTHTTGLVQPKADFINGFKTGQRVYNSIEVVDSKVRFYSEITAVVTGHLKLAANGVPADPNPDAFMEVWVRDQGAWRCAASALTRPPANK